MTDIEQALNDAFVKVFGGKYTAATAKIASGQGRVPRRAVMGEPGFHRKLSINSRAWRDQVAMKLLDGYGVEDIAVMFGCHLSHVQAEVQRLREVGRLKAWWGRDEA